MTAERKKRCSRCKVEKPWSAFYPGKKWPDGTTRYPQSRCKACQAEGNGDACALYHARLRSDPERLRVRQAQWREYQRNRRGITPDRYRVLEEVEPLRGHAPTDVIRRAIEASGRLVTEVSQQAGYEESTLSKALKGERITLAMATRVLEALDLAPAEVGL